MNTQFFKSTAKFSDFALLKKEAENLANNGKLVHWNTLEESERDANLENSCRFSKISSRESLTACNVGNYEVRPLFTLRAQNGKPEEGYICEFNGFQLWNTGTNEAYFLNSDKALRNSAANCFAVSTNFGLPPIIFTHAEPTMTPSAS